MGRTACTEPQCLYKGALYLFLLNNKFHTVVLKLIVQCWVTFSIRELHTMLLSICEFPDTGIVIIGVMVLH